MMPYRCVTGLRNISLRIPEEDDDFFEMLAKNQKCDKSKLYREASHDYKTRFTGEISLTELQRQVRLLRVDTDDLKVRVSRLEGVPR